MDIKSINLNSGQRKVMDILFRNNSVSRAEIAQMIGFARPTITQIVNELSEFGLLKEEKARQNGRGQPARPLIINKNSCYSFGVNFSHTYMEVAIIDLGCNVISTLTYKINELKIENISLKINQTLNELIAQNKLAKNRIIGVGISVPGDFYLDGTFLAHRKFQDFQGKNLEIEFSKNIDHDIFIENDGRACAMGERIAGIGKQFKTFMLVHIGHGVGGSLIIDGRPYYGAYGNAGIIGQFFPYDKPRPSGEDLIDYINRSGFLCGDFDEIEALEHDVKYTIDKWIIRAAKQLRPHLAKIARFFGPEAIIIAGRIPPSILNNLAKKINIEKEFKNIISLADPKLYSSSLGSRAGMIGAAALPIYHHLLPVN